MSEPVIYGPAYSTYVRTLRMILAEKGVGYRLQPVDILAGEGQAPAHLERHPFGKVPAFEHDGLMLYETGAIGRYCDEVFGGASLLPADAVARARMNQIIGVTDSYAYQAFVWKMFIERNAETFFKRPTNEEAIREALPMVHKCVQALEALAADATFLCGSSVTLADCWLAPPVAYFQATPEGQQMLAASTRLANWWQGISQRESFTGSDFQG